MNTKLFNIVLLTIWITIFVGLLTRSWWMDDAMLQRVENQHTSMLMALAGIFAMWNGARLWANLQASASARTSMASKYREKIKGITGEDPRITDPQFDFTAPTPETPSEEKK